MSSALDTDLAGMHGDVLGRGSAPELLKALTAHTPVGVFVSDHDGTCVYVNERWSELTGVSFAEALGDGWSLTLHPEDRERVAAEWADAAIAGRGSVVEYRFLLKDGSVTWVKGYASAVYGSEGLVGWVRSLLDVTEYRTAMQALSNEQETAPAAFDDAPGAMALVSPSGRFLRVNSALCQVVGYDEPALLGLGFQDITHPDDTDARPRAGGAAARRRDPVRSAGEAVHHPIAGSHWAAISVSLIRGQQNEPLHFVVHVEDIHEHQARRAPAPAPGQPRR